MTQPQDKYTLMKPHSLFSLALAAIAASLGGPLCAQTNIAFVDVDRLQSDDNAATWSINNESDPALLAGDASSGMNIFETALLFDISAFDSEITSAGSISFNIAYSQKIGDGQDITAYFFGTNASSINSLGGTSFHNHAVGGADGGTILAADFSAPGVATYEATTIVQSLTGFNYVGVLLTSGITSQSGGADDIAFYRKNSLGNEPNGGAYLSVSSIPEPGAYAAMLSAIALAGVVLARRRTS